MNSDGAHVNMKFLLFKSRPAVYHAYKKNLMHDQQNPLFLSLHTACTTSFMQLSTCQKYINYDVLKEPKKIIFIIFFNHLFRNLANGLIYQSIMKKVFEKAFKIVYNIKNFITPFIIIIYKTRFFLAILKLCIMHIYTYIYVWTTYNLYL